MRQLGRFRIEVIALFRSLMLLRGYYSPRENRQHRLLIAGIVSVSLLMSNICCAVAGMGEDLAEPASIQSTTVPNVPEEYSETYTDNIREPISFIPHETEKTASTGFEMPSIIHRVEDPANETFPPDELGFADQYSPMATSELLMPMSSSPVILMPKSFVHERKTVRTSERTAEIWVRLPKDSQSSVSVNFVEHPPEGDFRIFRTRINTLEPRRFYLSAKRWDVKANRWIDLVAVPSLSCDETPDLGYVDLGPGQRHVVTFTDNQQFETTVDVPSIHAQLNQIEEAISDNHTAVTQQIQDASTSIKGQVTTLQQSVAPHDKSSMVTKVFHFETTENLIAGEAEVEKTQVKSVNWASHHEKLTIIADSVPRALPRVPFTAYVTFLIQAEGQEPIALAPIQVEFIETASGFEGAIDFNGQLATPLANAFAEQPFTLENLQLAAKMEFQLDHGELGFTRVSGELGNKINVRIMKKRAVAPAP